MTIQGFFPETEMPDLAWWCVLWPDPEATIRRLGIVAGMEGVDLCCGDGLFTIPLARVTRRLVHGIDIDPVRLDRARAAARLAGARDCRFVEADALELGRLLPSPVDYVVLANALHGVPEPTRLARMVAAVLKPGGRFVIVNWHALPRERTTVLGAPHGPASAARMAPTATVAAVEPAGLQSAGVVELPPYHYGALFMKPCAG